MKTLIKRLLRPLTVAVIQLIYFWGCICYDKKYLTGVYFNRRHFSIGWQWILKYWFGQKVLRKNGHVPWPVPPWASIGVPRNIIFHPDDMQNFHAAGSYFQGINGKVYIGRGCMLAAGSGYITANHDFSDPKAPHPPGRDIRLGEKCWVGMNAVILPGVTLGPHTVVGAGSVVTKSFPEGHCVIAGNPARKLRDLEEAT